MAMFPEAESFRRLASGADRRPGAALSRAILAPLGGAWATVMATRNLAYDAGILPARPAPCPVVSIGNLTLGGTGKTPLVAWVVRRLFTAGHRPAIVSRGYGARRGTASDEALELTRLIPGVVHVADRDRLAGARAAVAAGADVVVLDDGLQHRRLARDIDLVAVDATDPFGCDHVFPRGLLRERLCGIRRAHGVILTRATAVEPQRRSEIRSRLEAWCGGRPRWIWAEASHAPVAWHGLDGSHAPPERLAGRPVAAFAGIGNPAAFRGTLRDLGVDVVGFRAYADHHAYSAADAADLTAWATTLGASALVTTLKDLVRFPGHGACSIPVMALEIAIVIDAGVEALGALVDGLGRCGR